MKAAISCLVLCVVACGPSARNRGDGQGGDDGAGNDVFSCQKQCSGDLHAVLDCNGNVITQCTGANACDASTFTCSDACTAAESNHRSIGCDYYATYMDSFMTTYCFAAFVANTWTTPAHIDVHYNGAQLNTASFTRLPVGAGPSLTYAPYDAAAGLPPGQVAVLFLGGGSGAAPLCPVASAEPNANLSGTGIKASFEISTDVPVVSYQINPYGGGSVAVTAASLLLPTSAWDVNYVAVNVSPQGVGAPSMNIIAAEDGTVATITPNAAITGGGGVPAGAAGTPVNISLNKGQQAQITQAAELTGSIITSNKPVGFMAGQVCMQMPNGTSYCDHGEQMVPPIRALGSHYVGVMYRPRVPAETSTFWRVVGVVDGTQLTYSSPVGGPAALMKGQAVMFQTGTPFEVSSQDKDHPFMLFGYMTSSTFVQEGFGDPDMVVSVPPEQYLTQYIFFADPTYPETNLVIVRRRGGDGQFHDVNLDCKGALTGWQPVGADYEWTRADLMTGNFMNVGNCSTGRHSMDSIAPFGLWVWGWGTPNTSTFTSNVSYGYPGGMNVTPINTVVIF
ncbi:MAG: hypothetical protein JWO36_4350 [Myxococcales bacterium]|nr:hypothetical protein [Myxococcales bacterium]